jgi:hypothetical protein
LELRAQLAPSRLLLLQSPQYHARGFEAACQHCHAGLGIVRKVVDRIERGQFPLRLFTSGP